MDEKYLALTVLNLRKWVKRVKEIVVYSKKDGVNRLLPIDTNNLVTLMKAIEKHHPKEKDFVYALVDGVEIKLF